MTRRTRNTGGGGNSLDANNRRDRRRRNRTTRQEESPQRQGVVCFAWIVATMWPIVLFLPDPSSIFPLLFERPPIVVQNMPDPHADNKGVFASVMDQLNGRTEAPFEQSKYQYGFPVKATENTLPPPMRTNETTVVMVLSARNHFERRAAIRESWAKENDNIYFVIGGPNVTNKDDTDRTNPLSVSSLLFKEQELYGDLIDSIHIEGYKSLPFKIHFGMKWIVNNLPQVHWVVKADDDHIVRIRLLQFFVLRKFNPSHPIVIGGVVLNAQPHRSGKWAEDPRFTATVYPPWAIGSAGYVVSRAIAEYIGSQDDLYYYQGEDAGLGIWLSESPLKVTWMDTPELNNFRNCEPKYYIIGHDWSAQDIKACFGLLGDNVPERKSIVAFAAARKDQHPGKILGA